MIILTGFDVISREGKTKTRCYFVLLLLLFLNCSRCRSELKDALLVIDVQNCFITNGTLAVDDGEQVIPVINNILLNHRSQFDLVVFTQDYHCSDHVSFASQHSGYVPYQSINLTYLETGELCARTTVMGFHNTTNCTDLDQNKITVVQTLWPDHCIIGTADAQINRRIDRMDNDYLLQKGYHCQIDSYSAFFDNGEIMQTELNSILSQHGVTTVYLAGLATDYCVFYTAKDAKKLGYKTYVMLDACRAVNEDTSSAAIKDMISLGIEIINSSQLDAIFSSANSVNAGLLLVAFTSLSNLEGYRPN